MSEEKYSCPGCGVPVESAAKSCDNCGEDLTAKVNTPSMDAADEPTTVPEAMPSERERRFCTECGAETRQGQKFCAGCGTALHSTGGETVRNAAKHRGRSTRSVSKQRPSSGKAAPVSESSGLQLNTTSWVIILVSAVLLTAVIVLSLRDTPTAQTAAPADPATQGPATPNLVELEALRAAADGNPSDAAAQLRYANALHDARMIDQAIARYKTFLETHPEDTDARVDLGICYFEKKDYRSAITEMETAVAGDPTHQLGHFNLGIVNLNAGNSEAAKNWFEKARDLAPGTQTGKNAVAILAEHFPAQ